VRLRAVKVCDRCGKRLTEKDAEFETYRDFAERTIIRLVLGDVDLCRDCYKEFFKTFNPKILALKKEVEEWVKSGR